jgi:hypothetical protein
MFNTTVEVNVTDKFYSHRLYQVNLTIGLIQTHKP